MEDKTVKISHDTHQRLVDFVVGNPVLKLNKLADIGINKLLDNIEKTGDLSSLKAGVQKQTE